METYFEPLVLAAAAGTGWAAANRLLSNPDLDMGLLVGMVLGASLVILILKARGHDVFLGAPKPVPAPSPSPTVERRRSREGARDPDPPQTLPPPSLSSSSASSPSIGTPTNIVEAAGQTFSALRRIASQTRLVGGHGAREEAAGNEASSRLGLDTGATGMPRSMHESRRQEMRSRFAQTLRDPRYNGVKLIDWMGVQIPFNEVVDFENEFFKGQVLFMLRTKPEDPRYVAHFAGKQRLFEMQIQGRFKKLPEGVLYMGAELTERMHLGLVTKTVAGMVLAFARRVLKNLHYSFGDKGGEAVEAEQVELPHLTFPLSRGMDRLVVTPAGQEPPPLGKEFYEPDETRVPRRGGKGKEPEFVLGPIYSMSFHSMYLDFSQWQLVNIAGQKSIDLSGYFGDASVHIVVYDLHNSVAANPGGAHRRCDKRYFYHCELVSAGGEAGLGEEDTDRLSATEAGMSSSGLHASVFPGHSPGPRPSRVRSRSSDGGGEGGRKEKAGSVVGAGGDGVEMDGLACTLDAGRDGFGGERRAGSYASAVEGEDEEGALSGSDVYVRSGDIAPLLAATGGSVGGWACVTEGKGYCIARPGAAPLDVHLIKVGGTSAYFRSDFLCNGDVVILRNSVNGKYLSVYKGWWLWWTPNPPSSSSSRAHFVIHGLEEGARVTVGRAFHLRHNKWASYQVGITENINSEYGGRMLGLYQTSKSKRMFQSKRSKTWLSPLQLKFQAPRGEDGMGVGGGAVPQLPLDDGSMVVMEEEEEEEEEDEEQEEEEEVGEEEEQEKEERRARKARARRSKERRKVAEAALGEGGEEQLEGLEPFFADKALDSDTIEGCMEVDVPAWIEMVHRHKKKPQLAYALRVRFRDPVTGEETARWTALRTGIDLAPVIQMQRRRQLRRLQASEADARESLSSLAGEGEGTGSEGERRGRAVVAVGAGAESMAEVVAMDTCDAYMLHSPPGKRKGLKASPVKEDKARRSGSMGRDKKGRHQGPSMEGFPSPLPASHQPLQHQNPADQSVRLLAQLLEEMNRPEPAVSSPVHAGSAYCPPLSALRHLDRDEEYDPLDLSHPLPSCKTALYSILRRRNCLDAWFLRGTAADMAVNVPAKAGCQPLQQSVVARALWESHWREEWMVLYPSHVSFFAMGTKKPGWSVFLHDILGLKVPSSSSKLSAHFPGSFFLSLETLGRVHYLWFASETTRDGWLTALTARVGGQAGYEMPVGVIISDPREAFVLKSGQWRPRSRIILNARRMSLDVPPPATTEEVGPCLSTLSVKALKLVYDLSPDSGTERLVSFLDLCSSFRVLPLHLLDLASPEALVFFLNIYHTLLQHALLLLGPPSSKDWSAFFTNVSYEMGNDVFSLTELEHCVLRGHLARPRSVPRHMPSPPPLDDDHYLYALSKTNFRINFALVNGSLSAPPFVTVFQAGHLNEQLNRASVRFIDHTVRMDAKKRLLVLPKVCDIYRADFSAAKTGRETMKVCLRFLERAKWERISWLMAGAKAPSVKYSSMRAKCHETLCLIEDKLTTPRNAVITSIGNGAIQATTPLLESNKVASPPIPEPLLLTPVATSKGALRNSSPPLLNLDKEGSSSASEDFDEEMEEEENDGGSISDELEGEASEELEAPVERDELVSGEHDGTSCDNGTL